MADNTIRYLYLLLIILLIGVIIFLVYLSHEYRQTMIENFDIFNPNINDFESSRNSLTGVSDYAINNIKTNSQEINNVVTNINNYLQLSMNEKQEKLQNDVKKNYDIINNLTKQITNKSSSTSYPINKLIKTIKSNYNSQYLSLIPDQNMNKYGILVNDKCLTVNGLCKDEFCTLECQNNKNASDSQKFYTNRIYTAYDAAKIMNTTPEFMNSKTVYPFNIFRSASNDKCLSINSQGVFIDNCNLNNINQQWQISPDENICVMK